MTGFLDTDGQPAPGFNQHLRARRTLDEMRGLCKGIVLDGEVERSLPAGVFFLEKLWQLDELLDAVRRVLCRVDPGQKGGAP